MYNVDKDNIDDSAVVFIYFALRRRKHNYVAKHRPKSKSLIMNHSCPLSTMNPWTKTINSLDFGGKGLKLVDPWTENIASWGNKLCAGNTQAYTYGGSKGGRIQRKRWKQTH